MEIIDRKFKINAVSLKNGKKYTERNAVLFLAKDALLPQLLDRYKELCIEKGVDDRQILGIDLLKDRVLAWQRKYEKKVHIPDIEKGMEERRVCRSNRC